MQHRAPPEPAWQSVPSGSQQSDAAVQAVPSVVHLGVAVQWALVSQVSPLMQSQ